MNAVVPYEHLERMAHSLVKSKLFGLENVDQAMALMAIAQAEGRHPALIARDFNIIQNRPAKKAEAMLRDFLAAGGSVKWLALDDKQAEAEFSHPQGGRVTIRWDMERAKQAGLAGKDMYQKYPRQMLRSRCVSEGVRTICPTATSGVHTPEEVRDMAEAPGGIAETALKDVTPIAAEPKILTPELIAEHLRAISTAADLGALKTAYRTAYSAAKQAGDVGALEQFERAKDAAKMMLESEDVSHE